MPAETARQAVDEFDIDAIAREYPFHIRHYPVEMPTDGVWRRFKRTANRSNPFKSFPYRLPVLEVFLFSGSINVLMLLFLSQKSCRIRLANL